MNSYEWTAWIVQKKLCQYYLLKFQPFLFFDRIISSLLMNKMFVWNSQKIFYSSRESHWRKLVSLFHYLIVYQRLSSSLFRVQIGSQKRLTCYDILYGYKIQQASTKLFAHQRSKLVRQIEYAMTCKRNCTFNSMLKQYSKFLTAKFYLPSKYYICMYLRVLENKTKCFTFRANFLYNGIQFSNSVKFNTGYMRLAPFPTPFLLRQILVEITETNHQHFTRIVRSNLAK